MKQFLLLFVTTLTALGLYAQGSPDPPSSIGEVLGESHAALKIRSNGFSADTTELKFTNMNISGIGTEFVIRSENELGLQFSSNSDLLSNATPNIMTLKPDGDVVVPSIAGSGLRPVMANSTGLLSSGTFYNADKRIALASASITATDTYTPIGPSFTFTKTHQNTRLVAHLLSRVRYTGGTASGVLFEVRAIGQTAAESTEGAATDPNNTVFITVKSVYTNLPPGTYTIQVYARAANPGTTSTGVILDPGNFRGAILVEEHF